VNRDILFALSPRSRWLPCRRSGAVVLGYRSDGTMVGARLPHNRVGYRSPSTTTDDIALALHFVVSTAQRTLAFTGRDRYRAVAAPAVAELLGREHLMGVGRR
jgi:hypothetical protein